MSPDTQAMLISLSVVALWFAWACFAVWLDSRLKPTNVIARALVLSSIAWMAVLIPAKAYQFCHSSETMWQNDTHLGEAIAFNASAGCPPFWPGTPAQYRKDDQGWGHSYASVLTVCLGLDFVFYAGWFLVPGIGILIFASEPYDPDGWKKRKAIDP